ncbi:MAG: hypothetical protein AUH92_05100 [Acidobacteria bacterium 13_1_40CM_4_69_4]|nr:MAG: hypothetical protein AUH92_05100 [Acidobacteria bacterium 13_1_40CM_4_69_4]
MRVQAGERFEARADGRLHRMRGLQIGRDRRIEMDRQRQHPGVLAGAVVMKRRGLLAPATQSAGGRPVVRRVGAALQCRFVQVDLLQDGPDSQDVERLTAVRSRHHGDLCLGEPEAIRRPRVEEREHLRRLGGRAQDHGRSRISRRGD